MFAAAKQRLEREHNQRAWAVWHIAALPRAKEMPDLSRLQVRSQRSSAQSWQEQLQIMQMWAAQRQQAQQLLEQEDETINGR
jgi:hypothetical protein